MNNISSTCKMFYDLEKTTILGLLNEEDKSYDSFCNKELIICDRFLFHFSNGDFDKKLDSHYLEGFSNDKKDNIKNIVSKYRYLCFKDGNYEYWTDSIRGASLSNLVYISLRILDNYDFLIKLCRDGGENVLKFISELYEKGNDLDTSVIDRLRCMFYDDTILENILLRMSSSDNPTNKLRQKDEYNDTISTLFIDYLDKSDKILRKI